MHRVRCGDILNRSGRVRIDDLFRVRCRKILQHGRRIGIVTMFVVPFGPVLSGRRICVHEVPFGPLWFIHGFIRFDLYWRVPCRPISNFRLERVHVVRIRHLLWRERGVLHELCCRPIFSCRLKQLHEYTYCACSNAGLPTDLTTWILSSRHLYGRLLFE